MAMARSPSERTKKNLRCELCHEVFRQPKLLSCSHTFCLQCLENLVTVNNLQTFSCPKCRKTIEVPSEGVHLLVDNEWITEQELQRERMWNTNVLCAVHPEEVMKFFCSESECDRPICMSCGLTDHRRHCVEDLSRAADRSKQLLHQELTRLERCIKNVTEISRLAQDNLKAARDKATCLEELVQSQYRRIVAEVTELRDMVLAGLRDVTNSIDNELGRDAHQTRQDLDSLVALRKRVTDAINGMVNEVEIVGAHKEMRRGEGSVPELAKLMASKPFETVRPVLYSFTATLGESLEKDALLYLGSPKKMWIPNRESSDIVTPFFRCGKDDIFQEIHSILRTADGCLHVAYGGKPPAFAQEKVVHIDHSGKKLKECLAEKRVLFDKSYRILNYPPIPDEFFHDIHATSNKEFRIKPSLIHNGMKAVIHRENRGVRDFKPVDFEISAASKPHAFDANAAGSLFVVINEEEGGEPSEDSFWREDGKMVEKGEHKKAIVRTVRLYRRNLSDPVATYQCRLQHFFPTAVTFWNTGRQEIILIADSMNDCVHMVRLLRTDFQFLRFLQASGCGDIVRPSALEVDTESNVWVGCETGWLLRSRPFTSDIPELDEEDEGPFLEVEIPSPRESFDSN